MKRADILEDGAMDNFWICLEAMAGILDEWNDRDSRTLERLKRELRKMPQDEHDRVTHHLTVVSSGVSLLATMDSQGLVRTAD
jgi:hypothetical protein